MSVELLASPQHSSEVMDAYPTALYEYEQLTSPDTCNAFGERIAEEDTLLGLERATVEEERQSVQNRQDVLRMSDFTDYREGEEQWEALSRARGELGAHEDILRTHQIFAQLRHNYWEGSGRRMLYDRHDSRVEGFTNSLIDRAVTVEQPFIRDSDFRDMVDDSRPPVIIRGVDEPLEFPLTSVVSAMSFESWETGYGKHKKDGRPSADVIKDYATRETPIPPVDNALALILEDGSVIIRTANSHRVAAAKLRGESTIQIIELEVRRARQEDTSTTRGIAALVLGNEAPYPKRQQLEQVTAEQPASPANETGRWQRFLAARRYQGKHRRH